MNSKNEKNISVDILNQERLLEERKHICTICEKGFTQKRYLNSHLLTHSAERPYQCSTCNKQFSRKSDLNKHKLMHSGEKPHECPTCQRKFTWKAALNKHLITHSGETPYECPTCQKRFTRNGNLTAHLRIHSGDKQYQCTMCQKRFTQKAHLNEHMICHSGMKPFVCPTCTKQFRLKHHLNTHMLIHSKKKQDTSVSIHHLQQNSLLIDKSSLERKLSTPGEIVKPEVDADLEPNKPKICLEVPNIKQELMTEEDLETPSCSYQILDVKQEPTENADSTCLNLCDGSDIKEERESHSTIL